MAPLDAIQVCRFCAAANGVGGPSHDQPLLVSPNFFVLPSLGGFIEGWLLVISRDHLLNLRQTPAQHREELVELTAHVAAALKERYGSVVTFEHGPGRCGSPAGCSIDHAHLHIVPHTESLRVAVEAESSRLKLERVDGLFARVTAPPGDSYIYLEELDGECYIGYSAAIESQLLRRVLARHAGRGSRFDWREDLSLETVTRTQAAFATL